MKAILKFWTLLLCAVLVVGCCDDPIAPELPDTGDENPPVEQPDDSNGEPDDPQEYPITDGSIFNIQITDDIMATVGTGTLRDVKYGNGRYVALFENTETYNYYVAYSPDGNSWTRVSEEISLGGLLYPKDGLKLVNGLFVVGGSSSFKYSTDGITWDAVDGLHVPKTFFNNKYYLVSDSSVWYTQTLSISSTEVEGVDLSELGISNSAQTCDAEVFNNRLFYCTDQGDLIVSSNGTDFTLVGHKSFPRKGQFLRKNGILVLVGESSSYDEDNGAFYTTDGVTWTQGKGCTLYYPSISYRVIVDYYNGVFIAYGREDRYNRDLYYSLDGKNWTKADLSGISDFTACCLL